VRCLKAEFCFGRRSDEYTIDCPVALGTLKRLAVRRNDDVNHDDWLLHKVVVQELDTISKRVYEFSCDRWFRNTNWKEFHYNEGIFITSVSFVSVYRASA